MPNQLFDNIVSLCKRRGFIYPNSEIYGGLANLYDFGPYGALLEKNIKDLWIKHMVQLRDDMVLIDGMVLMHPKSWEASGHIASFTDPLVDCNDCKKRYRADKLEGWKLSKDNKTGKWIVLNQGSLKCPECGGELLPDVKPFNQLMETYLGVIQDSKSKAYLKGESCQNIYLNYPLVRDTTRVKIPFGIAQIGKAFRNEITPGQFIFRVKEFEQMDVEFFTHPKDADKWYKYWKEERWNWYTKILGINENNLQWYQHPEDERIFYAKDAWDIKYKYPHDWDELEGVHNRSDYDCKQHSKFSGKQLDYFNQETKERFYPFIIETSVGVSRILMAVISEAFTEEEAPTAEGKGSAKRTVLKFKPELAPIKAAVFPLVKDEEIKKIAKNIHKQIKQNWFVEYDEQGSIGRRYRRQDEIGTPFCITVDFDSLKDKKATVRDRDTLKQERVEISNIEEFISNKIK